jgi:chromate transporter
MHDDDNILWLLVVIFAPLSLLSIGGWVSVLAPMHHEVVEVRGWFTQREFVDIFAISRAAPGPGALIVALIGWKLAGWAGAIVGCLAIFIPSSLLCYGVGRVWNRYRGAPWHMALELGLTPVGVGLLCAGGLSIMRATGGGIGAWAIAVAAAAAFVAWRKVHPLIILALGGAISVAFGQLA